MVTSALNLLEKVTEKVTGLAIGVLGRGEARPSGRAAFRDRGVARSWARRHVDPNWATSSIERRLLYTDTTTNDLSSEQATPKAKSITTSAVRVGCAPARLGSRLKLPIAEGGVRRRSSAIGEHEGHDRGGHGDPEAGPEPPLFHDGLAGPLVIRGRRC